MARTKSVKEVEGKKARVKKPTQNNSDPATIMKNQQSIKELKDKLVKLKAEFDELFPEGFPKNNVQHDT